MATATEWIARGGNVIGMTEADALAEKARTEEALRSWAKAKKLPEVLQEFYGLVLQLPHGADRRLLSVLEAAIPWTKIPLSKLKDEKLLEKLNPDIGKLRSEAHRRMTEAEKRGKALQAKEAELAPLAEVAKLIERVKQEPKAYRQLARDLGVSKDELDAWHEEEFAPRLLRMIEEKEAEMKGPEAKKALDEARELDRLRRENEDLKKKTEDEQKQKKAAFEAEVHRGVSNFMKDSLELLKFPELKWLAAREMTSILHRWNDTDYDGTKS